MSASTVELGRVPATRARRPLVDLALCLSLAAGLAHLVGTPEHLRSWPASGVFFAVLGVAQSTFAWLLFRQRVGVRLALAGVAGNAAVVVLYVVSRTAGLPFAPAVSAHGGRASAGRSILPGALPPVGAFDLATLTVELALLVVLAALLPARPRRFAVNGLLGAGAALWLAAGTGLLG